MRWCDRSCPQASFPREDAVDGAGSCRTFAALHCALLGRLVAKNAPCAAEGRAAPAKKAHGGEAKTAPPRPPAAQKPSK